MQTILDLEGTMFFWVMEPCVLVGAYRRFGGKFSPPFFRVTLVKTTRLHGVNPKNNVNFNQHKNF